ncbi:hypothetical protein [Alkalihalophilus marmarensis]|uniref:hypothetical protein n=1 Tax=Alkalihalophilus marmarensis TaxID=521377 RepID=UPI002E1ED104|nr:hypothetical protein [Alkalihalophilus marmarensis]
MSKYKVLEDFTDLKDKNKVYRNGDTYPKPVNKKVSKKRLDELSTTNNRLGLPLIQLIEEELITEEQE